MFALNVRGPFLLSTNLMEKMAVRGHGAVINVTSAAAYRGYPGLAAYGAVKAALESLTKSWAAEFGGSGIRINSVSPGQILTPGIPITSEEFNRVCSHHGLGRHGFPEDVADAVAFLAGKDASYLSGSVLHVDGGMLQTQAHGPIRLH
jgi:NAD(P)-dependent dehydrogenase (short-subunit alcohol dehydrogenase family)